jgi:hypothetical protein
MPTQVDTHDAVVVTQRHRIPAVPVLRDAVGENQERAVAEDVVREFDLCHTYI